MLFAASTCAQYERHSQHQRTVDSDVPTRPVLGRQPATWWSVANAAPRGSDCGESFPTSRRIIWQRSVPKQHEIGPSRAAQPFRCDLHHLMHTEPARIAQAAIGAAKRDFWAKGAVGVFRILLGIKKNASFLPPIEGGGGVSTQPVGLSLGSGYSGLSLVWHGCCCQLLNASLVVPLSP